MRFPSLVPRPTRGVSICLVFSLEAELHVHVHVHVQSAPFQLIKGGEE